MGTRRLRTTPGRHLAEGRVPRFYRTARGHLTPGLTDQANLASPAVDGRAFPSPDAALAGGRACRRPKECCAGSAVGAVRCGRGGPCGPDSHGGRGMTRTWVAVLLAASAAASAGRAGEFVP